MLLIVVGSFFMYHFGRGDAQTLGHYYDLGSFLANRVKQCLAQKEDHL